MEEWGAAQLALREESCAHVSPQHPNQQTHTPQTTLRGCGLALRDTQENKSVTRTHTNTQ